MNKVQKLLLGLVATTAVSSSFADVSQFYFGIGGGIVAQNKLSSFTTNSNNSGKFKKAPIAGEGIISVGYYVMENFRVEAAFVKPFLGDSKYSYNYGANLTASGKLKTQVNSLQVRGYYDVAPIADMGKLYVGAGLGWAQVSAKSTTTYATGNTKSGKAKSKNTLAWLVGLGGSFNVADGAKIALEYNYQNFGQAKSITGVNIKPKVAGHAVVAKLMFDL